MYFICTAVILFQAFIFFCCIAVGSDTFEKKISDEEQMKYLAEWEKKHNKRT